MDLSATAWMTASRRKGQPTKMRLSSCCASLAAVAPWFLPSCPAQRGCSSGHSPVLFNSLLCSFARPAVLQPWSCFQLQS